MSVRFLSWRERVTKRLAIFFLALLLCATFAQPAAASDHETIIVEPPPSPIKSGFTWSG